MAHRRAWDRTTLLAEPEGLLRLGIGELLSRAGSPAACFASAEEVLNEATRREKPPALLITAGQLPGLDGLSLARALRARWPELAVVLIADAGMKGEGWWRALPPRSAVLERPVAEGVLLALVLRLVPREALRPRRVRLAVAASRGTPAPVG